MLTLHASHPNTSQRIIINVAAAKGRVSEWKVINGI
jgi:hypothetical protein